MEFLDFLSEEGFADYVIDNKINLTAIYAAIVSTIVLIWNIKKDINDIGRLKVHFYIGNFFNNISSEKSKDILMWKIVNSGRRPIVLADIGGESIDKGRNFVITGYELPKRLEPGEFISGHLVDYETVIKRAKNIGAYDSLGNFYTASKKDFNSLSEK